ncbi:MAG: orotidine-5'-phosphate decarboxylase, partial [Clostridia bacterium]|nr:orotidine-5'-phosphate decarboxylase [Clostridia bacterium]
DVCEQLTEFNKNIIDNICDIVPAVKVQVAYYEMYGVAGMQAFANTLAYAKSKGMITMADIKRNDIGSTASAYSKGYLGKNKFCGQEVTPFESDFITINGYLGTDGIKPFADDAKAYDKGAFILVKTSNPSSGDLQNKKLENGNTVFEEMATFVCEWGKDMIGKYGYSDLGAVVGATHKAEAELLRKKFPSLFFLVPGYGAQGATAEDVSVNFDQNGLGAIVNSSRGILCAYKKEKYAGLNYYQAARQASLDMQQDLTKYINL